MILKLSCGLIFFSGVSLAQDAFWTKTYGGSYWDGGSFVSETPDRGYIITGYTASYSVGGADVWLIRTDENGNTLWTRTYGGAEYDWGRCVQVTSDSGYIIVGYTESYGVGGADVWLIRVNQNGDTLWTKTYGGTEDDRGSCIQVTSDSGYIIVGGTGSYGVGGDVWLIRTDNNGDTLWTKTYGGIKSDEGRCVQVTSDDGYIIAGSTESYGAGQSDFWLIRTDKNGDTLWTRTYGNTYDDEGYFVQETPDSGFIITGNVMHNACLIRTDKNGNTLWTKVYEDTNCMWTASFCVEQTSDEGYILTGYAYVCHTADETDLRIIRTDKDGNPLWIRDYGENDWYDFDDGSCIRKTSNGDYIIVGSTESYGAGKADVWLLKIEDVGIEEITDTIHNTFSVFRNFPNPFNNNTIIKYELSEATKVNIVIYNLSGQKVAELLKKFQSSGHHTITWDGRNNFDKKLSSGVYFCRIEIGKHTAVKKLFLIR